MPTEKETARKDRLIGCEKGGNKTKWDKKGEEKN
jgi:hypothetical protein